MAARLQGDVECRVLCLIPCHLQGMDFRMRLSSLQMGSHPYYSPIFDNDCSYQWIGTCLTASGSRQLDCHIHISDVLVHPAPLSHLNFGIRKTLNLLGGFQGIGKEALLSTFFYKTRQRKPISSSPIRTLPSALELHQISRKPQVIGESRARTRMRHHRRSGISPCPEDSSYAVPVFVLLLPPLAKK